MAGFGEPLDWTRRREEEAKDVFPTLQFADPDQNMEVDMFGFQNLNQPPSTFSQSALSLANYAYIPEPTPEAPDVAPNVEGWTPRTYGRRSIYDQQPEFANPFEEMAAGRILPSAPAPELTDPYAKRLIENPISTLLDVGAVGRGFALSALRGEKPWEASLTRDVTSYRGIDTPFLQGMLDEGIEFKLPSFLPFVGGSEVNLTPKTVAGFALEVVSDPTTYIGAPIVDDAFRLLGKFGKAGLEKIAGKRPDTWERAAQRAIEDAMRPVGGAAQVAEEAATSPEVQNQMRNAIETVRMTALRDYLSELPEVPEGHTRMYRGVNQSLGGDIYAESQRTFYTPSPVEAAQYGSVHYLDVPNERVPELNFRSSRYATPEDLATGGMQVEPMSSIGTPQRWERALKESKGIPDVAFNQISDDPDLLRFEAEKAASKRKEFLSPKSIDELRGSRVYTTNNGRTGYLLTEDGDFGSLLNNSDVKGAGQAAILDAIQKGAMTLDAYDGHLPETYRKFGFEPVARVEFDERFAPKDWDYEKYGRPDIIHMAYTGGNRDTILSRVGTFDAYERPEFLASSWDEAHERAAAAARDAERRLSAGGIEEEVSRLNRGAAEGATGVYGQSVDLPPIAGSAGKVDPNSVLANATNPAVRAAAESAARNGEELPVAYIEHLDRAYALVDENRAGSVANFFMSTPGFKQTSGLLYRLYNRAADIPDNILAAYNAHAGVLNRLPQMMFSSEQQVSQQIERAFGKDALGGSKAAVKFIGTPEEATINVGGRIMEYPALNTFKDVVDRPNLYNLTNAQANAIKNLELRNDYFRQFVNDEYFAGIEKRNADPNGAHLPTVGRGEILGTAEEEARQRTLSASDIARVEGVQTAAEREIAQKRALIEKLNEKIAKGERVKFNTTLRNRASSELDELLASNVEKNGFTRWAESVDSFAKGRIKESEIFVPETNVRILMRGLDDAKIRTSAKNVFNAGLGGMSRRDVIEQVMPGLFEKRDEAYKTVRSLSQKLSALDLQGERDLATGRALRAERRKLEQRLSMRTAESGRANQFIARRISEIDDRLEKLRNNETRKRVQNAIDSISSRLDDIVESEKLNPEGVPAIRSLEDDIDKIAEILDDKLENRQVKRDAKINQFTNELEEASKKLREVRRAYNGVQPEREGYEFVYNGVNKYFKKDEARKINDLLEVGNGPLGRAADAISSANATILGGDIGPLVGQQGQIAFFATPVQTTKIIAKSLAQGGLQGDLLRGFRASHLAERARQNPQWERYAEALQFSLRPQLPEEFGGGWLMDMVANIPKVKGEKLRQALEGMYSAIRLYQLDEMDDLVRSAMSNGVPADEAVSAAAATVTNLIPTSRPALLGQSPALARAWRVPLTSITFATKPFSFANDMISGMVKTPLGKVSLREKQSAVLGAKMFGNLAALSATSQMISAMIDGKDENEIALAGLRAMNPSKGNRYFLALQIPGTDTTIPLGTTFRSVLQAMAPQVWDSPVGVPIPIPYAGVPRFYANRVQPFARRSAEAYFNQPVYGKPGSIRDEDADTITQFAQSMMYVGMGMLPLTAAQPYESWREEQSLGQTGVETAGQFLGLNVQYPLKQKSKTGSGLQMAPAPPKPPSLPKPPALPRMAR